MSRDTRVQGIRYEAPTVRRMLRVDEVAGLLSVSKDTVRRLLHDGDLEGRAIRGALRVFADSVARYQEEAP